MKKLATVIVLIILCILLSCKLIYAQWIHQTSNTDKMLLTVHFLNENEGWAGGHDGTILKTTNGGNIWTSQNIGTLDNIHSIFFIDSAVGWAVLFEWIPNRHGSIVHSTDGGESWNTQFSIQGYTLHSVHFTDENNGWVVGSNGVAFHTTNGGITWVQQYPNTQGGWLWPIFFIDNNIGWTAGDPFFGMLKSTDGGNSWSSYTFPVVERIYSLIFLDSQTGWLSAAQGQVAKSVDGGITWDMQQTGTSQYLRDIYFLNTTTGWSVGYNGTIIHSSDGGNSWEDQYSGTLSDLYSVQFIDDQAGWIVGDNGIILHTDNGGIPVEFTSFTAISRTAKVYLNWTTASETNNLGFEVERKIINNNKEGEWIRLAFVEGYGTTTEPKEYSYIDDIISIQASALVYRLKQLDFNGSYKYSDEVMVENPAPVDYALYQNYPNPFNPNTTVKYQIPELSFVTLKIYDVLGSEVKILVDEEKGAGSYRIVFNSGGLPSGIYFYRLQAGDFVETKKMVLLR